MGILSGIKRQLRSVIQWENPSPEVLVERWTENGDEIKNASKLIVGPGQGCVFVHEGKVQAVHMQEGLYELKTSNIPFITTLTKIMQSFVSEHKVGIYFFKTTKIIDQKWGTQSTIKYLDPKYKFPVGLKAFGNYSFRIKEGAYFFQNVVGQTNPFPIAGVRDAITARLVQPLSDYLAEAKFTFTEIDSNRNEIVAGILPILEKDFEKLGFSIDDFRIEGTAFDDDTMKRINRIADVSAEAQAADAAGINYAQLQQLEAMKDAAKNPGGGAGMFMGLGVGANLGQQVVGGMTGSNQEDPTTKLKKLKAMLDQGLITQEEFDAKKKEILSKF